MHQIIHECAESLNPYYSSLLIPEERITRIYEETLGRHSHRPPGDALYQPVLQCPRQKYIGVAGEFLHIGVAEKLRQLLESFHRCHGRAASSFRNSKNND